MTRDTLIELIMGQLQRLLVRHARDREIVGKLGDAFQLIQGEKYHEAVRKVGKLSISRKVKETERLDFVHTVVMLELLDQGFGNRQLTPAVEKLVEGPRAEIDEVAALIEKLRKQPRIDYRLRATSFRRASWPARLLLAGLALVPLWLAAMVLREGDGGLGYYLAASALGLGGLTFLILAVVGEKKSVEKTLEQL